VVNIKYLVFGDVHSNLAALEAMLEKEKSWDEVIFLGDAVVGGPQPDEVLSLLSTLNGVFIKGNHDKEALNVDLRVEKETPHAKWIQWTRRQISNANIEFLKSFSEEPVVIQRCGLTMTLIHGCLSRDLNYRLWPDSSDEVFDALINMYPTPYIIVGHSHVQFVKRHKGTTIINPGGLGQPRLGKPLACYAVLDENGFELKSVEYDTEKTCNAMDRVPLEKSFIEQWKKCYRTGILPEMYKIRDFNPLMEMGYV